METLVGLIIALLILGIIFAAVIYIVDHIPVPAPFNMFIKAAVGVIIIIYLLGFLLGYSPHPVFLRR